MDIKRFTLKTLEYALAIPFALASLMLATLVHLTAKPPAKPRLVWGPTPIINNKYWSGAMKEAGYTSTTLMLSYYGNINKKADFDEYVTDRFPGLPTALKLPFLFWESLWRFDIFIIPFHGWLLGRTILWRLEAPLLRLAGKKIITIPYGADTYVYRDICSSSLQHGLMASYPAAARQQDKIRKKVNYWTRHADCLIPGVIGVDGIGRWDVLSISQLYIDTALWAPSSRNSKADGTTETVYITHTPNHTGFKGTEFLEEAVSALQQEGLKVELLLIQNKQNDEVRRIFQEEADILAEQLIFTGYAMSALEGLASGLPVISNLEDENITLPFRRWSFLNECPIVSSCPETIKNTLRTLVTNPDLRAQIGQAGREYVEKYHSYEAAQYMFGSIIDKIWHGKDIDLINLYHPLKGAYPQSKPAISHPLIHNKLPT